MRIPAQTLPRIDDWMDGREVSFCILPVGVGLHCTSDTVRRHVERRQAAAQKGECHVTTEVIRQTRRRR